MRAASSIRAAYRCDDAVLDAARAEERELAALGKDARHRRVRAVAWVAGFLVATLVTTALAARIPVAQGPALRCHQVTVRFEQPAGAPPPPMSWRVCERR